MIVVVGLSHRSAPLAVRERLALSAEQIIALLRELLREPEVGESMMISTCNRVELVLGACVEGRVDTAALVEVAKRALSGLAPNAERHLYSHEGEAAVRHLFRVAASLDSLVVGEPQILGQVKAAFDIARRANTVGVVLHRVVSRALRTAKKARTQTGIGAGQVSVPSVALDLAESIFGSLDGRVAALVGSGDMGETVAKLLHQAGASVLVVGRNQARVADLAQRFDGQGYGWDGLEEAIVKADIVVTSTSAPHYVVDHALAIRARKQRRGRSLFFIDVAVPRDVDPAVDDLDGVFLYNVDDLAHVVAESLADRRREAEAAEAIVLADARDYERWLDGEQVTPTIRALHRHFEAVFETELERSLRCKLKHLSDSDRASVRRMLAAALNKALHVPSSRLRRLARGEGADDLLVAETMAQVIQELFFEEDPDAPPSLGPPSLAPPKSDLRRNSPELADPLGSPHVANDSLEMGTNPR